MNVHSRAKTQPWSRELLVRRVVELGWSRAKAATAAGVSVRTVAKWLRRFREEGRAGLQERSSRPARSPTATPTSVRRRIEELRRRRMTGQAIAWQVQRSRATVARILRQIGLARLWALEPKKPVIRYERQTPGELIHVDIKKLGRFRQQGHRVTGDRTRTSPGAGWECAHVAVDDHSRLAYVRVLADEREPTVISFFEEMLAWYESMGLRVQRVMTDNGPGYKSKALGALLQARGIRHLFTPPYHPEVNGKAERFIQTALREWAYGKRFKTSRQRRRGLSRWLHHYNFHRRHSALDGRPPAYRVNNLMSFDS